MTRLTRLTRLIMVLIAIAAIPVRADVAQLSFGGRYPQLAMSNSSAECGVGAVVPWAGRLWVITYAPHTRHGSDDKLYEIDGQLRITARPESVGARPRRGSSMIRRANS